MILQSLKKKKSRVSLLSLGRLNIHFDTHDAEGRRHPMVKLASEYVYYCRAVLINLCISQT